MASVPFDFIETVENFVSISNLKAIVMTKSTHQILY